MGKFQLQFYEPYGWQDECQGLVEHFVGTLGRPELQGTIFVALSELAANALDASLRHAFVSRALGPTAASDFSAEQLESLYRAEVAAEGTERLAKICRQENWSVRIQGAVAGQNLVFSVVNTGKLSTHNKRRIAVSAAGGSTDEEGDEALEGSRGLSLVIQILRGLGLPAQSLRFAVRDGMTWAFLSLPLRVFNVQSRESFTVLEALDPAMATSIFERLDYGMMTFDRLGGLLTMSGNLVRRLSINSNQSGRLAGLLPRRFFEDVFGGPSGVLALGTFENYRIWVPTEDRRQDLLFNVSGFLGDDGEVHSLWQEVVCQSAENRLSEGSMLENLQVQTLIKPYVPALVLNKAREVVRRGQKRLPTEIRDTTVLFADLVGFTAKAERMDPQQLMELLNLSLGLTARSIEQHGGYIDKFMGDAILAIFGNPLAAVAAAVEVQTQFQQLNEFRVMGGAEAVELRIGIHSGKVIVGNVGTNHRMDWTVIGDVVNTASRIEKESVPGAVLISEPTFERIRQQVITLDRFQIRVKGKAERLQVMFVKSVSFNRGPDLVNLILEGGKRHTGAAETKTADPPSVRGFQLLAGGIGHDFSNILAVAISHLEVLSDAHDSAGDWHLRIADVISDLLQARMLSRQLVGLSLQAPFEADWVDLASIIREVVPFLTGAPNISVVYDFPQDLLPAQIGPRQLAQAVANLTTVALQTLSMGGTLHFVARMSPFEQPGRRELVLRVEMLAPGQSGELPAEAPEAYPARFAAGTESGLSITQSIVAACGGRMDVASVPGYSTRVDLRLPAALPSAQPSQRA